MKRYEEKLDGFVSKVKKTCKKYFPSGIVVISLRRANQLKMRIHIEKKFIIDIYYNSYNERTDFSLVEADQRIFGYDNLGGWHYHPTEDIQKHVPCDKPEIDTIFKKIQEVIKVHSIV